MKGSDMGRRRLAMIALCALLALGTAACGDGAEPPAGGAEVEDGGGGGGEDDGLGY